MGSDLKGERGFSHPTFPFLEVSRQASSGNGNAFFDVLIRFVSLPNCSEVPRM